MKIGTPSFFTRSIILCRANHFACKWVSPNVILEGVPMKSGLLKNLRVVGNDLETPPHPETLRFAPG